jgi:RNA polymerase sigma-70 factor (ECF subfamily)
MDWSVRTDNELIQESRTGNHGAFKELVRRYEDCVASTVIGMLGFRPEADDVGQEVFIRFFHSLGNFKGQSSLKTYLTRIAINLSLNELRRRKRHRFRVVNEPVEEQTNIPDETTDCEFSDEKEMVTRALEKLKPEFRIVIVLRFLEGYSTRETAEILRVPEGTVLSRLARAMKKLKTILEPYFGEDNERQTSRPVVSVI